MSAAAKKKPPQVNPAYDNPSQKTVTWLAIGGAALGTTIMAFVMLNRKHAAMEACGLIGQLGGQIGGGQ